MILEKPEGKKYCTMMKRLLSLFMKHPQRGRATKQLSHALGLITSVYFIPTCFSRHKQSDIRYADESGAISADKLTLTMAVRS